MIEEGKYASQGEGPEYETVELMGADCGIDDLAPIAKANYLCNFYGLDSISAACTVATSSPKSQRATSKSWIVMSRKIPPELLI